MAKESLLPALCAQRGEGGAKRRMRGCAGPERYAPALTSRIARPRFGAAPHPARSARHPLPATLGEGSPKKCPAEAGLMGDESDRRHAALRAGLPLAMRRLIELHIAFISAAAAPVGWI